jgi:lipopolysaccharide export system permease protein
VNRLSIFIIKAFIPPFLATFLIAWFVFIMQFFWLYIDDLVGKGLDNVTVFKLILYLAPTLVPMALPLGILLAGIMTFGNKAENSELTAIKSAGISLFRFALPSIFFVLLISGIAFLFNNYVIPAANLKFWGLLADIRNTKPAVNIKAGSFYNQIPGYSIYIQGKDADNKTIRDIMIYDHTSGKGNDKLIIANKGVMYVSNDKKYLVFELSNGCRYEERQGKTVKDKEHVQLQFKFWKKIFDLSSFAMQKNANEGLASSEMMLPNKRVSDKIDTTMATIKNYQKQNNMSLKSYIALIEIDSNKTNFTTTKQKIIVKKSDAKKTIRKPNLKNKFYKFFPDSLHDRIFSTAISNAQSIKGMAEIYKSDNAIQQLNLSRYKIEWHRKITLAISCLILFLIGAPLGAIIRKGGFGMPFVTAVVFFVLYRFLNVFSEQIAEQGKLTAFMGMWLPPAILSVIALLLFYFANVDSKIFTKGYYSTLFTNKQKLK